MKGVRALSEASLSLQWVRGTFVCSWHVMTLFLIERRNRTVFRQEKGKSKFCFKLLTDDENTLGFHHLRHGKMCCSECWVQSSSLKSIWSAGFAFSQLCTWALHMLNKIKCLKAKEDVNSNSTSHQEEGRNVECSAQGWKHPVSRFAQIIVLGHHCCIVKLHTSRQQ